MPSATLHQHLRDTNAVQPGEHLWVVIAAFEIVPDDVPLDAHAVPFGVNGLLALSPPGCFVCEQEYDPVIATLPCPGQRDA